MHGLQVGQELTSRQLCTAAIANSLHTCCRPEAIVQIGPGKAYARMIRTARWVRQQFPLDGRCGHRWTMRTVPCLQTPVISANAVWFLVGPFDSAETVRHMPIYTFPFLIGRRQDLPLSLSCKTISTVHAEITEVGRWRWCSATWAAPTAPTSTAAA